MCTFAVLIVLKTRYKVLGMSSCSSNNKTVVEGIRRSNVPPGRARQSPGGAGRREEHFDTETSMQPRRLSGTTEHMEQPQRPSLEIATTVQREREKRDHQTNPRRQKDAQGQQSPAGGTSSTPHEHASRHQSRTPRTVSRCRCITFCVHIVIFFRILDR